MRGLALALLFAAGCSAGSRHEPSYPSNPFPNLQTVAVLPVLDQTTKAGFDGNEFGDILASELLKFPGFRAVRPAAFRGHAPPRSVDEAVRLGRQCKVDAVLVAVVTDHDPYDPPRIAVSVQLLRSSSRAVSAEEVDRLVQSASWRQGPLAMSPERAGHWVAAFEDVFDAHDARVRRDLAAYAQAQVSDDSGFLGEREFLAVQSRYFQFVSHQILQHLFRLHGAP